MRDLGVVFAQYLTFHDYISGICKSTHFHLRDIGRIRNLLTFDATAQLIHALITSRLDLCNSILYNIPNKQIERLQRIQNQAARMLKRIPRRNHITPVLRELYWLRIYDRINFKILWKALDLDIRLLPFDTSKKSVKTHLYLKYFVN